VEASSTGGSAACRLGWTGPCPPPGPVHHYRFELRALAPTGKVLAAARLTGLYRR